jgi:flavin reductase (DIM6/NTAB) family NADH-FMN oxidoreductase RutF
MESKKMMRKKQINPYRPVFPSPAGLITSVDESGNANIITLGEVFNISIRKPVIVGIAIRPATYSHGLIFKSREYVINLPTAKIYKQVDQCGMVSGRVCRDKFKAFGLTPVPALYVSPPLIAECPVNIECKVIGIITVGDHDLFLGTVVAVHADEDVLDEHDTLITDKLDMLVYISGEYVSAGKCLGKFGFTVSS